MLVHQVDGKTRQLAMMVGWRTTWSALQLRETSFAHMYKASGRNSSSFAIIADSIGQRQCQPKSELTNQLE